MFAIKLTGHDVWAGKRDITWFVCDDQGFVLHRRYPDGVLPFGVPATRRRIFGSSDEIRRSLRRAAKETVVNNYGIFGLVGSGITPGKFSNYEVHDLVTGVVHPLDDVMSKKV